MDAKARRVGTWACLPSTTRGRGVLLGSHTASRYIAYCNGRTVVLRSLDDPRQCSLYTDHSYPVTVARFSPNGEWVASGDASGVVRVWARGGEHVLKYECKALSGSVDDLQWSEDGQRILCCGDGKQHFVRAFMWDSGGSMGDFEGHSKRVLSCTIRPKRPFRVFSCGEDFAVNYYEGPPFRFKHSNKSHTNFVNCVRFSPDGSKVLSVSSDKKGLLFSAQTGEQLGTLTPAGGHSGSVYALAWSPDSLHVVTVSADKTAKVWKIAEDGAAGEPLTTFAFTAQGVEQKEGTSGPAPGAPVDCMQVGCLWVGDTIVTLSLSGSLHLLPLPSSVSASCPASPGDGDGGGVRCIQGHSRNITALALSDPAGAGAGVESDVYSASYDGVVVRWAGGAGSGAIVTGSHSSIVAIACAAGKLVTVGLDDTMRFTPLPATTFSSSSPPIPLEAQPRCLSVAWATEDPASEQAPLMLVATAKGLLLFRGATLLVSKPLSFDPAAAAISPDGKQVAVGSSADGTIQLLSVSATSAGAALEDAGSLSRHRGPITCLSYSPDGAYLASGDQNREAVVWDTATGEAKLKNLVYHTARVSCVAWSPDSSRVATGSLDMSILVYSLDQPPSQRLTIKGTHVGGLSALLFLSPSKILSAGQDACLHVWELD